MRMNPVVPALVLAAFSATVSAAAMAGPFDVKAPEIEAGETEIGTNHSIKSGFPADATPVRHTYELAASHAFTSHFKFGVRAGFDTPVGESGQLSVAGVEAQVFLGKIAPSISWGWFAGLDVRVHRHETNTVTFGPLLRLGNDTLALTLNPLIEQTFGPNSDDRPAFAYAIGLKGAVREGLAFGVEAHGSILQIGDGSSSHLHEHRIGPVLYIDHELSPAREGRSARKLALEIGTFVGLTDATPDWTGKIKAALTW